MDDAGLRTIWLSSEDAAQNLGSIAYTRPGCERKIFPTMAHVAYLSFIRSNQVYVMHDVGGKPDASEPTFGESLTIVS